MIKEPILQQEKSTGKTAFQASEENDVSQPLSKEMLRRINAYWRAANYLSVGQIYLYDNPLLKELLTIDHIKPLVVNSRFPVVFQAMWRRRRPAPFTKVENWAIRSVMPSERCLTTPI